MRHRRRFWVLVLLLLVLTAAALFLYPRTRGGTPGADHTDLPQDQAAALQLTRGFPQPSRADALAQLDSLRVAKDGPMKGYTREKFPHWRDASTFGWPEEPSTKCNTRQAALYRDAADISIKKGTCSITHGKWLDPYTATWYTKPTDLQVDHIVPIAEAWRSGAAKWTTEQRTAMANDPLVLVPVQGSANGSKGDKGPDAWKPPNKASHCLYAERYTAVKAKYRLTVTEPEKKALADMIRTCTK